LGDEAIAGLDDGLGGVAGRAAVLALVGAERWKIGGERAASGVHVARAVGGQSGDEAVAEIDQWAGTTRAEDGVATGTFVRRLVGVLSREVSGECGAADIGAAARVHGNGGALLVAGSAQI